MKKLALSIFAILGAIAIPALAHHAFSAEFDLNKPVTVKGVVTKIEWMNPHAWIYMDVKNASGGIDKWECELGSPNAMTRAGFTQDSVKLGEEIVLDGILAKKGTNICSTRTVKGKDGRTVLSQTEGAK